MDGDASVFLTIGRGLLHGQTLYLSAWDDKPPLIFYWSALVSWIWPTDPYLGMQILSSLALGATAAIVSFFVWGRRRSWRLATGAALFMILVMALPYFSTGGGLSELFAVPAMTGAYVLSAFSPSLGAPPTRRRLFVVGALVGLAVNTSLWALIIGPVVLAALLAANEGALGARLRSLARELLIVAAGALAISIPIWLPLWAAGAGPAAIEAMWNYNAFYHADAIFISAYWFGAMVAFWPIYWPLILTRGLTPLEMKAAAPILVWFGGGIALLLYSLRLYTHYFMIILPVFGLLLASPALGQLLARHRRRMVSFLLMTGLGLGVIFFATAGVLYRPTNNDDVVAYIRARTASSAQIYVWGYNNEIYLAADRLPAGPYSYLLPLMTPGYGEGAAATMLAAWQAEAPALIVDSSENPPNGATMAELLLPHGFGSNDNRTLSSVLNPLRAFVREHYTLAATLDGQPIYALTP